MTAPSTRDALRAWLDDAVGSIEWEASPESLEGIEAILRRCGEPDVLARLCDDLAADEELLAQCERFNLFAKLVLHRHASGAKLRLHAFGDTVYEAHNHRAPFGAMVLHGSYVHVLYGGEEASDALAAGRVPEPLFVQRQAPHVPYVIGADMVHATLAEEGAVSLMLQGPAVRDQFHIVDLQTEEIRVRVGGNRAAGPQEQGERPLSAEDVAEIRRALDEVGVTPGPAACG